MSHGNHGNHRKTNTLNLADDELFLFGRIMRENE